MKKYQDLKDDYCKTVKVKPRPETYVTDENKSVKWNREQVIEFNDTIKANKDEALEKSNTAYTEYHETILSAIMPDLEISEKMAKRLIDYTIGTDYETESDRLEAIEDLVSTMLDVIDDRIKVSEGK